MKQVLVYLAVALGLTQLPGGTDVGKLAPAQLVHIYMEEEKTVVRTDLDNMGMGDSLEAAFADLQARTPGKVFLDTAEYLLISREAEAQLPAISRWLKKECLVCLSDGVEDLASAAAYLQAHPPELKLKGCKDGAMVCQILQEEYGQFRLEKIRQRK